MTPIAQYLQRLDRRLWLRRAPRAAAIEEIAGHLAAIDGENAFTDIAAIERRFAPVHVLAARITRAKPTWQLRFPWRLLVVALIASLATDYACAWSLDCISRSLALNLGQHFDLYVLLACLAFVLVPTMTAAYAARIGGHRAHIILAALLPTLLLAAPFLPMPVDESTLLFWLIPEDLIIAGVACMYDRSRAQRVVGVMLFAGFGVAWTAALIVYAQYGSPHPFDGLRSWLGIMVLSLMVVACALTARFASLRTTRVTA